MISRLHIANYALIDTLDIDFTSGLNIITGETGARKIYYSRGLVAAAWCEVR